jgi:hypothetical protein
MRYQIKSIDGTAGTQRHVLIDKGGDEFTTFPARLENPNYDTFLESEGLSDAEVQAMEPDEWHDMV